jgi:hypothetical protein
MRVFLPAAKQPVEVDWIKVKPGPHDGWDF